MLYSRRTFLTFQFIEEFYVIAVWYAIAIESIRFLGVVFANQSNIEYDTNK